jgi:hypothetical protein
MIGLYVNYDGIGKDLTGSGHGIILRYYTGLEELRKATKTSIRLAQI